MHPLEDKPLFGLGAEPFDGPHLIPEDHFAAIGKVTDAWADLEFEIDFTIWTLQEVSQHAGACATSQLISVLPKLDALRSLVEHWGFSPAILKRLGTFQADIGARVSKRNRIVHDKRHLFHEGGRTYVARFEISAKSHLKYGPVEETMEELLAFRVDIFSKIEEFMKIKTDIKNALPALRAKRTVPPPGIVKA